MSGSTIGTYTISYTTQGSCPITFTTTVQIIECPDTDGDGVPDITENSDGTNPNDLCDYVVNSQMQVKPPMHGKMRIAMGMELQTIKK